MDDERILAATRAFAEISQGGQMECYLSYVDAIEDATIRPFIKSGKTLDLEELVYKFFEDDVYALDTDEQEYYDLALAINNALAAFVPKFRSPEFLIGRIHTVEWHYAFNDVEVTLALGTYLESLWDDLISGCSESAINITGKRVFEDLLDEGDHVDEFVSMARHSWTFNKFSKDETPFTVLFENAATMFRASQDENRTRDALVALIQIGIRYESLRQLYVSSDESKDEEIQLVAIGSFTWGWRCVEAILSVIDAALRDIEHNDGTLAEEDDHEGTDLMLGRADVEATLNYVNIIWDILINGGELDADGVENMVALRCRLMVIGEKPTKWQSRWQELIAETNTNGDS